MHYYWIHYVVVGKISKNNYKATSFLSLTKSYELYRVVLLYILGLNIVVL